MADIAARDDWVDDDGDVCRVCRTEAEEGKPLIHPCKCSGSVRYVHADCLQEWLWHNGKRYCEICGHHYSFSKVYVLPPPSRIPVGVYVRQSVVIAARLAWSVARVCIAICSWLVVLPIITMCCLRLVMYFAENLSYASVAYGIRNVITDSHAELNETLSFRNHTIADGPPGNVTLSGRDRVLRMIAQNSTAGVVPSLSRRLAADAQSLVAFVFRGQIVAISVATGLIGLVLLREWISQLEWNERPPMEDEGPINLNEWTFRNGQAIRLDSNATHTDADSNQADAGYDTAEVGDVVVEGVEPEEEERTVVDDWEDQDLDNSSDDSPRQIRPAPADVTARAFIAPELLGEAGSSEETQYPEAGPSSRPFADVPEDVESPPSKPLFRGPAWDPGALSSKLAEAENRDDTGVSQWRDSKNGGVLDREGLADGAGDQYGPERGDVAEEDEERGGDEGDTGQRAIDRPHQTNGTHKSPLFAGAEDDKIPPDSVAAGSSVEAAADSNGKLVTLFNNDEADTERADERGEAASPESDSPETPGSPGSGGAFSEAEDEEENLRRAVAAVVDQYRDRTERRPVDRQDFDRQLADFNNGLHLGDDVAPELMGNIIDTREAFAREGADAGWEFVDHNNGFVVDAEVVERVMAVNNMDAAGMDIPPEDEDDRPLDADDWQGILGVIGFVGPLTDLLHNQIFVTFAMAFTLSVLVGLPVVIGKITLATDFIRASRDVYFLSVQAVILLSRLSLMVAGWFLREVLMFPRLVIKTLASYIMETAGFDRLENPVEYVGNAINLSSDYLHKAYPQVPLESFQHVGRVPGVSTATGKILDGLELLGRTAHELYKAYRLKAIAIAGSPDSSDQLLCMVVGYASLSLSILCVAIADAADLLKLSPSLMDKSRSIQRFLKVVFFMSLEIVCFPVFVGVAMDASTLPLFGATVEDRLLRLSHRPFGTVFVLWASGTIFMITFATFLTHMKKKGCRPGAVYFIRDPSDPSHSPVKEIMDRPALAQLPRLAVSASMYLLVVFFVCGAVPCSIWALAKCFSIFRGFLPLRLEQRPLTSVPFDLLFLHLVLPPSWEGLDMYRRFKKLFLYWWTFIVSTLDLSSLIFGIQARQKPQSRFAQMAWIVVDAACQFIFGRYDNRATRARVPNNDRVELVSLSDRRRDNVFIPLDHKGMPKTDEDKLRLLRQDRIARHAGRNPRTDYTTIVLPEHWRTRVYALLGLILLSGAALVAIVFFVPLAIGRQTASYYFEGPIYDGYSWLTGVYQCLGAYLLAQNVRRHVIDFNRAERLRRSSKSARFKRSIFGFMRATYAIVMLYLILPLLVGINVELFVSIPFRYGFSTDLTPVLHLWDAWATGATLLSLYVGAVGMAVEDQVRLPRGNQLREVFKKPLRQKFSRLTSVVLPPVAWLLFFITVPWLLCNGSWMGWQLTGIPLPRQDVLFRFTYPLAWIILLVLVSWKAIRGAVARIRQWMIDAEYVVAERVENYDSDYHETTELVPGATYHVLDGEVEAVIDGSEGEGDGEWEDMVVE